MSLTAEQTKIIQAYIKAANKKERHLSRQECSALGFNKNKIEYHFGSLTKLKELAKQEFPDAFVNFADGELFTPKRYAALVQEIKNHKKFVITTAVTGCELDTKFYNSLQNYCKVNDAMLLILPSSDPAKKCAGSVHKWYLDPKISKDENCIVFGDISLNSNLFISSIKLSAKHIDPITSLGRIGQRNGSFIYASPKQRLKMVPTSNHKLPHAVMTTGAVTKPNYETNRYMSERTAYIAEHDHVMGAVVVEVVNDKYYHFRQIQADKKGCFADLGKFYCGTEVGEMTPEVLVLGDYHSGETDPSAEKAWGELIECTKPEILVFHDIFNGLSICHHEIHKNITRARRAAEKKLDLEQELRRLAWDLNTYSPLVDKIVITKGNHDEFLSRYLEEGRYVQDPQNHLIGLKLATAMLEGKDPLKFGVELFGLHNPEKFTWLTRDEDFKVARIELGAHGDLGANGSRGSLRAMENAYGNSVSGHSHSPEILRGAWQVGTSTLLKLSYNRGPSSWFHTSCLVYANGSRQLISSIEGKWKL